MTYNIISCRLSSDEEPPMPAITDRSGNIIQVPGYAYRVSQQPEWLQKALSKDVGR